MLSRREPLLRDLGPRGPHRALPTKPLAVVTPQMPDDKEERVEVDGVDEVTRPNTHRLPRRLPSPAVRCLWEHRLPRALSLSPRHTAWASALLQADTGAGLSTRDEDEPGWDALGARCGRLVSDTRRRSQASMPRSPSSFLLVSIIGDITLRCRAFEFS